MRLDATENLTCQWLGRCRPVELQRCVSQPPQTERPVRAFSGSESEQDVHRGSRDVFACLDALFVSLNRGGFHPPIWLDVGPSPPWPIDGTRQGLAAPPIIIWSRAAPGKRPIDSVPMSMTGGRVVAKPPQRRLARARREQGLAMSGNNQTPETFPAGCHCIHTLSETWAVLCLVQTAHWATASHVRAR